MTALIIWLAGMAVATIIAGSVDVDVTDENRDHGSPWLYIIFWPVTLAVLLWKKLRHNK